MKVSLDAVARRETGAERRIIAEKCGGRACQWR
jgi:hypothetical protein